MFEDIFNRLSEDISKTMDEFEEGQKDKLDFQKEASAGIAEIPVTYNHPCKEENL